MIPSWLNNPTLWGWEIRYFAERGDLTALRQILMDIQHLPTEAIRLLENDFLYYGIPLALARFGLLHSAIKIIKGL